MHSRLSASLAVAAFGTLGGAMCRPAPAGDTQLATVRVAAGLASPVFVTHAPGDFDRLFIVEQGGRIRILKNGELLATPFLNISTLVSSSGERGLLGLAFHPNYADNGQFFINYTNLLGDTVVARHTVSENPDVADGMGEVVLTVDQPFANHNGGWLGFGPEGYLYIALGDGGDQEDPHGNGQSIDGELLGNILRIDVDGDDFPLLPGRNYAIPADNPFVGGFGEDEIWAYGLRNPWRCAFDRQTGDLWIADVGQRAYEEIDFQPGDSVGGENYGWVCLEGRHCTAFGDCDCDALSAVAPIHEYPHGNAPFTCSITGGEVYRGCAMPDLDGTYFFADYCSGQIWSLRYDGVTATVTERTEELAPPAPLTLRTISSFGVDAEGEVYLCDHTGGEVFKIVPAGGVAAQVLDSDPPDGAIDARTPVKADGATPAGWMEVLLRMDGAASCLESGDFSVSQEGGSLPAPTIQGLELVAADELLASLSRALEPRAWTTITHEASGTGVRLGYLPGDVNGDRHSAPADILDLIDDLNGVVGPLPIWSTDLDRSGLAAPPDVLQLVDLLNGAGPFEAYNGATLP